MGRIFWISKNGEDMIAVKTGLADNLEILMANGTFPKELLFDWVVDLTEEEFNSLCNEILSTYAFRETYENALVTDNEILMKPFEGILPRTEFTLISSPYIYKKKYFYRGLSLITQNDLDVICREIVQLHKHMMDNRDLLIINNVFPAVEHHVNYWEIKYPSSQAHLEFIIRNLFAEKLYGQIESY
jgi:hypothetical protein